MGFFLKKGLLSKATGDFSLSLNLHLLLFSTHHIETRTACYLTKCRFLIQKVLFPALGKKKDSVLKSANLNFTFRIIRQL